MRNFGAAVRIPVIAALTGLVALSTVAVGPTSLAQPAVTGLSLVKSASPQVALQAGDEVTYTFVVTNTGGSPVSGVAVDEVSFSGSGSAPTATCPTTTLAPGQTVTCTATYEVTDADEAACLIRNTAEATGTDPQGTTVVSLPASAQVVTACGGALTGSAALPVLGSLGSPLLDSPLLGSLAAGSLGLGSLGIGALGSLGALGAWALTTPYQPPAAAPCWNPPFPIPPSLNLPFLPPRCPEAPDQEAPAP